MTIPELAAALRIFDKHGDGDVYFDPGQILVVPAGDIGADGSRLEALGWRFVTHARGGCAGPHWEFVQLAPATTPILEGRKRTRKR
jgi:hypothetical protein